MGSEVYCYAAPDYDSPSLARAVEALLQKCPSLTPESRVLIKPNLLAKHAPEKAVTTHPAVLDAVLTALKKRNVSHIVVADSPGGIYTPAAMKAIYQVSGLAQVCARYGVEAYADCKAVPCKAEGKRVHTFNLLEPVHKADFIIDLPKLKTHVMTGMSCAVKNLFGTIPGLQKAEMHMRFPEKEPFGEMLVDLCEAVRPHLVIVDGILAMEGDGPAGGTPRKLGVVMGGADPYTVDLAVCRLMGLDAMRVPYLSAAHARGLCGEKLDETLLQGDIKAAAPRPDFKLPASYAPINFAARAPRPLRWVMPGVEKLVAPKPKVDRAKCIGCGKCAEICPQHTIQVKERKAHIEPKKCIRCFCCHEMCPVKAIDVKHFILFGR